MKKQHNYIFIDKSRQLKITLHTKPPKTYKYFDFKSSHAKRFKAICFNNKLNKHRDKQK